MSRECSDLMVAFYHYTAVAYAAFQNFAFPEKAKGKYYTKKSSNIICIFLLSTKCKHSIIPYIVSRLLETPFSIYTGDHWPKGNSTYWADYLREKPNMHFFNSKSKQWDISGDQDRDLYSYLGPRYCPVAATYWF